MKDTVTYPLSSIMDEDEESPADTPRTNVAQHNMGSVAEPHYVVDVDCSRDLERELAEAKKDSERLLFLMDQSGEFYMRGYQYHMIGRLREYIDAAMKEGGK